ncbi:diaminopimelate epimerase [Poseidonibacter lekithochrous]|uniref:diaminopimelate epimerase n=1 Tax=Poseidonibacter TaxID=2321187 RepID=UPI001C095485|nr:MULTISPECIES: diaminopimelate epimerase [Poseidonibacter]MBU3014378.1 diaminopimelate epimerase [Poseidonibacter lekithochrous]MDO6827676.1 diaminopimelate epimerase [Poseidonibacter sp. 1_MG-2023]
MTYTKYSASGNDFVIFHTFIKKDYSKEAIELCNRTEGIGADGLIVLVPNEKADFEWLFYNSDGSDASMCGNGTRACAHYAYKNGLAPNSMKFLTGAGLIKSIVEDDIVETELTAPIVIKEEFEQEGFTWYLVDTGVPHLVTIVDDLEKYDHDLSAKMRYEHNANVNFAKIEDGKEGKVLKVRTYERGVEGETLACGTGMAACFLRANNLNLVSNKTFVYPKSQEELSLSLVDNTIYFKGAVKNVFTTNK